MMQIRAMRRMIAILLLLAPVSVAFAGGEDAAELHGWWTMVAMADASGNPLPGVEVEEGDYVIEFRPDGTYVVEAFDGKGDSRGRYSVTESHLHLFEDEGEDEGEVSLPYTCDGEVLIVIFDLEGEDVVVTFHRFSEND